MMRMRVLWVAACTLIGVFLFLDFLGLALLVRFLLFGLAPLPGMMSALEMAIWLGPAWAAFTLSRWIYARRTMG